MSFEYLHADTRESAFALLAQPGALPVAGGTDLVPCVEEGISAPSRVVDIRRVPGLREIAATPDGGLRIGAAVTVAELAAHPAAREKYPVLAEACAAVGTPALRNAGTIGGNLVQRQHCWYFRRDVGCFKRGGQSCAAVDGEHQYHGISADGICRAVHPSDPAVALLALDARIEIASATATRHVDVEMLFAGAANDPAKEAQLAAGELIVAVELSAESAGGAQHWEKVMQRGAWDFALVSVAACRRRDGSVRMAMGGLALRPWRVPESIEEDVASGGLDEDSIDALVERAFYDFEPLAHNAYKRTMGQGVLKRAIGQLSVD